MVIFNLVWQKKIYKFHSTSKIMLFGGRVTLISLKFKGKDQSFFEANNIIKYNWSYFCVNYVLLQTSHSQMTPKPSPALQSSESKCLHSFRVISRPVHSTLSYENFSNTIPKWDAWVICCAFENPSCLQMMWPWIQLKWQIMNSFKITNQSCMYCLKSVYLREIEMKDFLVVMTVWALLTMRSNGAISSLLIHKCKLVHSLEPGGATRSSF